MALAKGARQNGARIIEGVKVTAVNMRTGKVTGVRWQQGEEAARSTPTSWSIAAACGAAIWRRNRRHAAAACLRAFLHRHRGDRGPAAAAGAAGAG
jgi:phytoene dehydrogenase-like protein